MAPSSDPGIPGSSDGTPGYELPKKERLTESRSIRQVFDDGQAFHGSRLVVFALFRPEFRRSFGVVAGRKVGGAVQRNRAKRLLREAYRFLKAELPPRGLHVVLVARKGCEAAPLPEVVDELRKLLDRAVRTAEPNRPVSPS